MKSKSTGFFTSRRIELKSSNENKDLEKLQRNCKNGLQFPAVSPEKSICKSENTVKFCNKINELEKLQRNCKCRIIMSVKINSCKHANLSRYKKRNCRKLHETAEKLQNKSHVKSRRCAVAERNCKKLQETATLKMSLRRTRPSCGAAFACSPKGTHARTRAPTNIVVEFVLSEREIGLARFFGTAQKFSQTDPDFLEPAKKIFGGAA